MRSFSRAGLCRRCMEAHGTICKGTGLDINKRSAAMRILNRMVAVSLFFACLFFPATAPILAAEAPGAPKDPVRTAAIGEGVVISVDRPENCLRIRRGPSVAYEIIGCAGFGEKLRLTGVFSSDNRWAQLDNNGWVLFSQVRTDLKPPRPVVSHPKPEVVEQKTVVIERSVPVRRPFFRRHWRYY